MAKVKGIGGIFFRSSDPAKLGAWYSTHLGLPTSPEGHVIFPWRDAADPTVEAMTVWSAFPEKTDYFGPTRLAFMINYIVDDLDAILDQLRAAGAEVETKVDSHEYGRFAWTTDPEGNRIELWEPPKSSAKD